MEDRTMRKTRRRKFQFHRPVIIKEEGSSSLYPEGVIEKFDPSEISEMEADGDIERVEVSASGGLSIYTKGGSFIVVPSKANLIDGELLNARGTSFSGKEGLFTKADAENLLALPADQQRQAAWLHYCARVSTGGGVMSKFCSAELTRGQAVSVLNPRIAVPHLAF